jgi:hypothetical protein
MKRRVFSLGVLLAISLLLILGNQGSNANNDGNTGRFKTVEIKSTQYVWELVSLRDGHVICQAIMDDRPTRPTLEETVDICEKEIFPAEPTPTPLASPTASGTPSPVSSSPTQAPFDLSLFLKTVYWRFVETRELVRTIKVPLPEIIVNLSAPSGPQNELFVTISAYEPVVGERITAIYGMLNGWEFTCPGNRCNVPVSGDSLIEFWAASSFGDESKHVQATLRQLPSEQGGKRIEIASIGPIPTYIDSCAVAWSSSILQIPDWAKLPATPDELNTAKPYQYLAGKLIAARVVDASSCPGGGLSQGGAPNACGLEKASGAVIDWQNQFDITIWDTGRSLGVPPKMIKAVIGQESQFWPGNSRNAFSEYGLGQLSQSGADVVLRWDNDLFRSVCSGLLYDCSLIYGRMPAWLQATMRGGLMQQINVECPTCAYGLDINKTHDTVGIIGRTLRANCRQVKYIMDRRGLKSTYEDLWRFTLVSYHSGYQCLSDALNYVSYNRVPADWENVNTYMGCYGAKDYADEVINYLKDFDLYRLKRPESSSPVALPTFALTPAPTLTPTPVLALSHVFVQVYQDANGNYYPDSGENVDGVKVEVRLDNGQVLKAETVNGVATIDLTGQPVDINALVVLPELYRSQRIRVVRDGEIPVIFRLDKPVVPPGLP